MVVKDRLCTLSIVKLKRMIPSEKLLKCCSMPNAMLKMHEACTILVAGIIMNYALL